MSTLITIKEKKNIKLIYLLQSIYGINKKRALIICKDLGLNKNILYSELNKKDLEKIDLIIYLKNLFKINIELNKYNYDMIDQKKKIKSYQGLRHIYKLPVNGQNTQTNAKTNKWKRKK